MHCDLEWTLLQSDQRWDKQSFQTQRLKCPYYLMYGRYFWEGLVKGVFLHLTEMINSQKMRGWWTAVCRLIRNTKKWEILLKLCLFETEFLLNSKLIWIVLSAPHPQHNFIYISYFSQLNGINSISCLSHFRKDEIKIS